VNAYNEMRRGPLSPELRKCLEDIVTGQDVPGRDISLGATALETLTNELAIWDLAMHNVGDADVALMLDHGDMRARFGRLVVRAQATFQLVELLELQPEAVTEAEAAE
jgi:hypothetical protein